MDKIKQMLLMQQNLNDATSGKDWEKGLTDKGKIIDWKRCVLLESAELINSYPWKHWKNIKAQPDFENIKIEVVDIWHFVMSEALRVFKIENLGDIEQLSNEIKKLPTFPVFKQKKNKQVHIDIYEQIKSIEYMIKVLFTSKDVLQLLDAFFAMASDLNLYLDELYNLYIGKNILNQFRQNNGYKEGSYKKVWGEVEDNVVMQNILAENINITPDNLYKKLENLYKYNN